VVNWTDILISSAPFILLIAFWIFFMVVLIRRRGPFRRQYEFMQRNVDLLERQQQLLERIAIAIEERNRITR
jgi:hypothetical protein